MTEATSARSKASGTDDALIAEISPAMLVKLKNHSLLLLVVLFGLEFMCAGAIGAKAFALNRFFLDLAVVCSAIGILVSILKYPLMLKLAVRYRRRHGRWRWER